MRDIQNTALNAIKIIGQRFCELKKKNEIPMISVGEGKEIFHM
jgi:hypothetical protein